MLDIISQFGGKGKILLIALFILSFFLINSLVRNKMWRTVFALLFASFIILQLTSLFSTQSFIGYQFYIHSNLSGLIGMINLFIPQIIGALVLFLILASAFYSSFFLLKRSKLVIKSKAKQSLLKAGIVATVILSFTVISLRGSFISDSHTLFSLLHTNTKNFKEVLKNNNMANYVTPDHIKSKAGKNIIILSLESIEKAFLNNKYSQLTPNLNKLKKTWKYLDLEQNPGSSWTSGSLYTYLTGFPAFFGIQGNQIFQTAYHSEISSISHVLKKAGYSTTYLNGNTEHSGVKEMLLCFDFDKIIDLTSDKTTGNHSVYGIRDKDLFELAKKELSALNSSKEPFALFISTTDTHYPNGIYDKRMESVISKKDTELEFMVAAVDYMIGDLILFLQKENILETTSVYIFPDHLKMGDPSMFIGSAERGLYVITNAKKEKILVDTLSQLFQIDLPKIILSGAEIQHNQRFLTDYITGNKGLFIKNNILSITEINTNGLLRIGSKPIQSKEISKKYEIYKKDTLRYIAHAGGEIDGHTYTDTKEAMNASYDRGFRLLELDILETTDGKYVSAHKWEDWVSMTGFKGATPVSHKEFLKYKILGKYTPMDMDSINKWFLEHSDAILVTDKINDPIRFSKQFIAPQRLIMELFSMDAVKAGIKADILSAMPSQRVVNTIKKEDIKYLKKLGVKNIAISRRFIEENHELLLEYKRQGIKAYIYNIGTDPGLDADYATKYELDFVFGMYADCWNFK